MAPNEINKLAMIADKLYAQTVAGKITWSETDDKDAFICDLGTASILVEKYASKSSEIAVRVLFGNEFVTMYRLRLINANGNEVEQVSRSATADGDPPKGATLAQLYEVARRSALRVDDVLDDVLKALDHI